MKTLESLSSIDPGSQNQRIMFIKQVRRWGSTSSDGLLDPTCKIFTLPQIDGFIGYNIASNCAVIYGDPVCDPQDKLHFAEAFNIYCKEQKLNILYAIASQDFAKLILNNFPYIQFQFGNNLIFNPTVDPLSRKGPRAVLVRKKVKHAKKEDVEIQEYLSNDSHLKDAIEKVGVSWLKSRKGPQINLTKLNLFENCEGKRWFYAKKGEKIIGVLVLNKILSNDGWLITNLMVTDDAPSGTSELLIVSTFKKLAEENCQYVTVGPVTTKQLGRISGLGPLSSWLTNALFKMLKKIFCLDAQGKFWEKFQPDEEPSFLIFDKINFHTIKGLLRTLNVKFK